MTWTPETRAIAIGMKRAGIRTQDIANRLGVTVSAVSNMCCKAGARKGLVGKIGDVG